MWDRDFRMEDARGNMAQTPAYGASALDSAFRLTRARLVPFLLLMYILSFLDRANIGFAKQAFQASAGISDAAYALGAGLFFLTYALLEVPSNLIMHRVGARIWMARIMVTWGLISAAMMSKGRILFLSAAPATGRCRSRVFSRGDPVPDVLVSPAFAGTGNGVSLF